VVVHPVRLLSLVAMFSLIVVVTGISCGDGATMPGATIVSRSGSGAPIVVAPGAPIVVGVSVPLTGPDGAGGRENLDAVIAGVERWKNASGAQIKGHDIEVRAEDDGCTETDMTIEAAQRLLGQPGLVGVMGPDCSTGAAATLFIYDRAGVVTISGAATRTDLTDRQAQPSFFFRTVYRNQEQGTLAGLFVAFQLRAKKMYDIDDGELYGRDLADAADRAMREAGVEVIRVSIPRGTENFSDLAARIVADKPDFVGFAGFPAEAALLYRQLRSAGYTGPFGAGDAAASVRAFVMPVGEEQAEGVVFAACSPALPQEFLDDFRKVHGSGPVASANVGQYADAVTILLNAVAQVAVSGEDGSLSVDPLALRDAVAASYLPDGLSGSIAFDAKGDRIPKPGDDLRRLIAEAWEKRDVSVFVPLGLVPCQVQDGSLVNLAGEGSQPIR
jgi:branched-chain amino acid transport system substrate-binding protein